MKAILTILQCTNLPRKRTLNTLSSVNKLAKSGDFLCYDQTIAKDVFDRKTTQQGTKLPPNKTWQHHTCLLLCFRRNLEFIELRLSEIHPKQQHDVFTRRKFKVWIILPESRSKFCLKNLWSCRRKGKNVTTCDISKMSQVWNVFQTFQMFGKHLKSKEAKYWHEIMWDAERCLPRMSSKVELKCDSAKY